MSQICYSGPSFYFILCYSFTLYIFVSVLGYVSLLYNCRHTLTYATENGKMISFNMIHSTLTLGQKFQMY